MSEGALFNMVRGEYPITICGEEHILRFDFEAMQSICDHFGVKTVQAALEGFEDWGPKDIATLIAAGLRGGGKEITTKEVTKLLLFSELPQYSKAITDALNAGNTSEAEVAPQDSEDAAVPLASPN